MQYPDPHRAPEAGTEVLISIAAAGKLPPRVRLMLEGMLALCGGVLERVITLTLNEFEQLLFKDAERARNATEQHDVFAALREVKRGRADVAPRFMQHLESTLARLDASTAPAATAPRRSGEMSLVDNSDLDELVTLTEIATKGEIRHSQSLFALGHRLGVLAEAPMFDAETMPLGPHRVCDALRYAVAGLGLKLEQRLALYRLFDRHVVAELGVLYAALNDYLVEKHILRHLQVVLQRPRTGGSPADSARARQRSEEGAEPAETAAPTARAETRPRETGPSTTLPATPPVAPAAATVAAGDGGDADMFATLRELLAGRRAALGAPAAPASASSYTASGEDLQSVLGALQNRPAAPMMLGGRLVQRSLAHVKQDMLAQLRQFTPDGRPARLAEEDSDTIDLLGLLFDHIVKDVRPSGVTQALLTKLQVPVLRVALRDKGFFTRRQHPARQLLNAIAETGSTWMEEGDGEADRALVEKMQLVVDRATSEFDGRPELFEELLGDLSRHMGTLARKAEVAERRHVDAAKGRERLDVARERAAAAMAERLIRGNPTRLVRTLLEQAWTDVLALTLLRQGENSEVYRRRLAVAEALIAGRNDGSTREDLEQGLSQVGFLPDEIQTMVRQIVAPSEAPAQESPSSRTEMAMRLKARTRLGEDGDAAAPAGKRPGLHPPLNEAERAQLEHIKTLPFGTWFEFVTNQQGDSVRRKLSWFSTMTGRCLFVNQRGARAEERTMEQLARDLHRGQVRLAPTTQESIIDRAWNAIMSTLRHFSGSAAPAPG